MQRAELIMRRKNVGQFIAVDSREVVVTRLGAPVKSSSGGTLPGAEITLPKQTVRIVQNTRRYTANIVNAEAGDVLKGPYVLVARHNTDFQKDDSFWIEGEKYVVLGVFALREESVLASVDFYGPANRKVAQ